MSRQFGAFTGLAMLLIVLNHSISLGLDSQSAASAASISSWARTLLTTLQALGVLAVPVFFFVSGGFIAYAAQGNPPRLSRKFLFSSLRHILIPYVIWSLVFYALLYFLHGERYSLLDYVKNLLVGYPYHFIPLLVFYYLFSPVLVILGKRFPVGLLLLIALYQLFLINAVHPGIMGFTFPGWAIKLTPPVLRNTMSDWAIFFPLGVVYGLHTRSMQPFLKRFTWLFLLATALIFLVGTLDYLKILEFPMARYLCMVTFVLAIPGISRDQIPLVRLLERVGKRSYGLYLLHLIILDLVLIILQKFVPGLISLIVILLPLLFVIGLMVPILLMEYVSRSPARSVYRYIFG